MSGAIHLPPPQYAFMAWCSAKEKQRVDFTFTFTVGADIVFIPLGKGAVGDSRQGVVFQPRGWARG
jgi:hypothetical protein